MIQPGYQFFYLCLNCIVSYHDNRNSDDKLATLLALFSGYVLE